MTKKNDLTEIDVTKTALEVPHGYKKVNLPVKVTKSVWYKYFDWTDEDNEKQTYQEEDARLWDILFSGGACLQSNFLQLTRTGKVTYSIYSVVRDGISEYAELINIEIKVTEKNNKTFLVIDKGE